jgi:NTP pyrophosphatase (non-canonical NTP hydrolase)
MAQLEQLQQELIDVLTTQVVDLSMMSKIELGDDVIKEIKRLNEEIDKAKCIIK